MNARYLTLLVVVLAAGTVVQASGQQSPSGWGNSALPERAITDLIQSDSNADSATIFGVTEPFPQPVMDAAQDLYQLSAPSLQEDAAARLEVLGNEYPVANTLLGGAVDLGLVQREDGELPLFLKGAQQGDVLAQHAVDRHYLFDESGTFLLDQDALEEMYIQGAAPGSETTLARYYQFGIDGPPNAELAEKYWSDALANSFENPVTLFGYAQFLQAEGRLDEAGPYISKAATRDYGPAVAEDLRLARLGLNRPGFAGGCLV